MIQGIDFVKIENGEVVEKLFVSRTPAIKAFINTSNMGPNAHAGQDQGWRLGPVWFNKLQEARSNATLMLGLGVTDETPDPVLLMKLWNAEVKADRNRSKRGGASSGDSYREIIDKAVSTEAEPAVEAAQTSPKPVPQEIAEAWKAEKKATVTHVPIKDESEPAKVTVKKAPSNKKK